MRIALLSLAICFAFLLYSPSANAQFTNGFSVKYIAIDHLSPLEGKRAELLEDFSGGGEIAYYRGLNENFNLAIPLKFGTAKLPLSLATQEPPSFFLALDATVQFQPFVSKSAISPYALTGLGLFLDGDGEVSGQFPIGAGLNIRVGTNTFLQFQTEYRTDFGDLRNNFMHSAGLFIALGEKPEPVELPPSDVDGDGIPDKDDQCPTVAGLPAFVGCPDTDNDGITDKEDACPEVAGLPAFAGCPDTDGDGVSDDKDQCPEEKGLVENDGCPLADADGDGVVDAEDDCPKVPGTAATRGCPDSDGDGFIDSEDDCPKIAGNIKGCPDNDGDGVINKNDRCPDKAGPASNKGCPEIKEEVREELNFVAQNVQFETGKATLKAASHAILDKVVNILQQYPAYSVAIGGHTDSIGGADTNQVLSERRAKSCYDYLASKGIASSRMTYTGYGETRPIGDNRYKEGRKKNRRVEFDLFLK